MSDIRLLVLNCEFPPIGGGAATATRHLLRELDAFPVKTTLVTAGTRGAPPIDELTPRCRVHYLPMGKADLHYWSNRELAWYAFAAARQVSALAREEEFDLCHAFFTLPAGAVAWWQSRSRPYIVSLRGSDVPGFSGRYTTLYRALRPLFKTVWRGAGAVVANSEGLKDLAHKTAADIAIEVIPNGVDTDEFHPELEREDARTILTVARLVPRKDVATPVHATALLAREFPEARLIVVGDGPEAEPLRLLAESLGIAQRVEFRRYVAREEIAKVYREADVFMLTSGREGMSNTVLEAIASGLPVVASADALAGITAPAAAVVAPGDARAAAEAAARFFTDAQARRAAAAAALKAAANYTWHATAERYFGVYEEILAGRGARRR
jgi:L-malate glycosyltransferase